MSLPCKQPMVAWWHFLCPSFLAFWLVTLRTPLPSSWLFFGDSPLFWWFFCHAHAGDHMPATLHAQVTWWTLIGRCPAFNYSSCTSSLFSFSCSTFNHACCYLWPALSWILQSVLEIGLDLHIISGMPFLHIDRIQCKLVPTPCELHRKQGCGRVQILKYIGSQWLPPGFRAQGFHFQG